MSGHVNKLRAIWQAHPARMRAGGPLPPDQTQVYELLGSIFCPGPFYYFIFDFESHDFTFLSPSVADLLDLHPEKSRLADFMQLIHPEDIDHIARCEKLAGEFYFHFIDPEEIMHYKPSYCFRVRHRSGHYILLLHQVVVLRIDEHNKILTTLAVHSDISHLADPHNKKISFMHLNGGKHYMGLSPNTEKLAINSAPTNPLSAREIEVLRLLAEGDTLKEISEKLYIAENTAHTHRSNIRTKLSCRNTTQAVSKAIREGWI